MSKNNNNYYFNNSLIEKIQLGKSIIGKITKSKNWLTSKNDIPF